MAIFFIIFVIRSLKMKQWKVALDKFLERYIHQSWFEGALLSGSYASGNQNKFSDIDVTIIASNDINWQEKSNCFVDGFLIEYIINLNILSIRFGVLKNIWTNHLKSIITPRKI